MLRFIVFFLLIPVFFNAVSAKAQEAETPLAPIHGKLTGNWSFPDCRQGDEALTIVNGFYLKTTKAGMFLAAYAPPEKQMDHWTLRIGDTVKPMLLENDGILSLADYIEGSGTDQNWDELALEERRDYTHCENPAAIVPKNMRRLMRFIDRVARECTVSLENDCARVLFKLADANSDQKLSAPEIRDALESALTFAHLSAGEELSTKDLKALKDRAQKGDGKTFAETFIADYDADASKNLTYDEIVEHFKAPASSLLREILEKSGSTLPAFGIAAKAIPKTDSKNTPAPAPAAQ